ncbi:MAG: cytochrome c [Hyphomicrobiales bacterium]
MKRKLKYIISLLCFTLLFTFISIGQSTWKVPDNEKNRKNPVSSNPSSINTGKKLYQTNCKSCHGDPGKNNGLKLQPPPPDMKSDIVQDDTEGEIHYKITAGMGAMPSFKNVLSETDRWSIVNYIKSLSTSTSTTKPQQNNTTKTANTPPASTQNKPEPQVKSKVEKENFSTIEPPVAIYPIPATPNAAIKLTIDSTEHSITANVSRLDDNSPLSDAEVNFYVQRYFGLLPLYEDSMYTDDQGQVKAIIPKGIIGDKLGHLHIIAKLIEDETYGDVQASVIALWGEVNPHKTIVKTRSLWAVNRYAPLWLAISYFVVVIGIWLFIVYIIRSLFIIRKVSGIDAKEDDHNIEL